MKVEYISHCGNDNFIANVARVSFGDFENFMEIPDGYSEARRDKLIQYLANHNHWTPFGHANITLRMEAPVPIRTQCFKHKVGFVENEESRRYISTTPSVYVPEVFRGKPTQGAKQGSEGVHPDSEKYLEAYQDVAKAAVGLYENMIEAGIAPEQARFILPQGCQVNWVWTGSIAAFARVYKLRKDPHAQQEIQELADKIDEIIRPLFPVAWAALVD